MEYRLIALDMDGTVLTGKKTISSRTEAAICEALSKGKEVLFATGRCPSEMREYLQMFPDMKYALCLSGALVFDVKTNQPITEVTISKELAKQLVDLAEKLGVMVNVYAGADVFVEKRRRGNMEFFNCQCFASLYDSCAVWVDNIREVLELKGDQIYKVNFYCPDEQAYQKASRALSTMQVSFASGIPNNCEISPCGVNKGEGLKKLSEATEIPVEQMIAVGDEGNDIAMIRVAGLGIAMGNASDAVIEAADAMTADCDHDGVAEVIKHCLL